MGRPLKISRLPAVTRAVCLTAILLITAAGTNVAINGSDDPAFQAALTLWLDDDEKQALPSLSRLTKQGNTAALLLLAMIDKTVELQGPWLGLLPRAKRIKLMRAPGGISGKSWLNNQKDTLFAKTWLDVWSTRSTVDAALVFTGLHEPRAARRALMFLEARQGSGFAEKMADPGYPRGMQYLAWQQWRFEGGKEGLIKAALAGLHAGDPQRIMMGEKINANALQDWLGFAPAARPLAALCRSICPGSVATCSRAALLSIGGYARLMSLGSPVAAVLSDNVFMNSRRAHMTIIRAVLLGGQLNSYRLGQIETIDACFAAAVDDEAQNF